MTRADTWEFLIEQCKNYVAVYTGRSTSAQDGYVIKFYADEAARWQAALDLLESEKEFHMNLFGKKE